MKRLLFALILVLTGASFAEAQGILFQLTPPAPNAQVFVCPSPDNGYPCPTQANIFSNAALTIPVAQPVSLGPSGFLSFYIAAGTYIVQLTGPGYNSGNRITITVGGGGGGAPSGPAGGDLNGTYPNPTVDGVNGAALPISAAALATNGAGQIIVGSGGGGGNTTSTTLTTNTLPKANGANSIIDSLFTDTGSAGAYTGTNGFTAPALISSGTCNSGTAGCLILSQGTIPTVTANNSITEAAPAAVTDYVHVRPGVATTGIPHYTTAGTTLTESISAVNLAGADVTGNLPFTNIGAGTNTGALLVGAGGSLGPTSTGTITATNGLGYNASPVMGFYFTNKCPATDPDAVCVNTFADALQWNDCNWSNASTTLNCTASHFTAANTGMNIMGGQSCVDDAQGTGNGGQISTTAAVTVTFVSGTQLTLSATPANTVASNGCIIIGHLDDTAATALDALLVAAPTCPKLFLAASNYYFAKPHFFTNPTACIASGPGGAGALSAGSTTLPAGFEVDGRGTLPTTIFLDTSFPGGDACTHKGPQTNGGCFSIPVLGKWTGFRIDGGAQTTTPNLAAKNLITMAVGTLENFTCTNMGWQTVNTVGINMGVLSQLYQVNNAGCGGIGLQAESGGGFDIIYRTVVENSTVNALNIAFTGTPTTTTVTCYWCLFALPKVSVNRSVINNAGGWLSMFGGSIQPSNGFGSTSTGITGYRCTGANGIFKGDEVNFLFTTAVGGTGANSLWLNSTGCTASLINSVVNGNTSTSTAITDFGSTSGTRFTSLGGNTITGPVSVVAGMSLNLAPTDTLSGASTFSPVTCTQSAGNGTCAFVAGSTNEKGTVRITAGTTTLLNPSFSFNFLGTFFGATNIAPECTFIIKNTGTGSWITAAPTGIGLPFPTAISTTAVTVNILTTVNTVATSTYDVGYTCVAK